MSARSPRNARKPLYSNPRNARKPVNNNPGNYGPRNNGRNHNRRKNSKTKSSMPEKEKSDFVYYVSFKEGPMGIGLDTPPGNEVGSVVSIIVERSQADETGLIRVGDIVEQVGMVDIRKLNHDDTSKVIQSARRPVEIKFRRAQYHLLDI